MHEYELTYILNPNLGDDEVTSANERIAGLITSGGGDVTDVHPWGGKRRLAYPIEHHRDGYYVTIKFRAAPEAAYALDGQLKLNDNVIRHLTLNLDEEVKRSAKAPVRTATA